MTKLKKLTRLLLTFGLLAPMLYSCKPTEKGYQQAYEAAKSKREQKDPDDLLLTGGHKLLTDGSTQWKAIGGDTLELRHKILKPTEGGKWPQSGPYRLAVATLKMTTNANAMLAELKKNGSLDPVVATDGRDTYYVIAGSATYADSLGNVLATFRKENPGFRYIGMSAGKPVVIVGR